MDGPTLSFIPSESVAEETAAVFAAHAERILSDPALVARYNALKLDHEGGMLDDYKAAKREFFWEVVRGLDATG